MDQRAGKNVPLLATAALGAMLAFTGSAHADSLTRNQQLAHDIYKELTEIDATTATGDTKRAAEAMAARLKAAGFPDEDVHVFSPPPRKGDLVATLHGTGKRKPILLVAHLDVVPANREDWSVDPFKLTEQDGYFYARGSGDDKYMGASFITNLIRYKQEGFKPDRDIIVALETDEELGSAIEKVSHEFWPDAVLVPVMSSGATDGSYLRNAGIPTFGHSGMANDINEIRAHGKDERVPVKSFYHGDEYLYRLVKTLSGGA